MARRTMNTRPERSEYRRSFVACGGGRRFRLKGTSGAEGRRIFIAYLHVIRRRSGHAVVALLLGIPNFRLAGADHFGGLLFLLSREAGVVGHPAAAVGRIDRA